jgi:hypothetical protein
MPIYLQILLLVAAFIIFVVMAMLVTGWGIRRVCFKIIAELEEARAFSAAKAMKLQDERKNFFRVGTGNLRPKAINLLIQDGIAVKAGNGKYFLDKEKLAEMRSKISS